MGTLFENKSRLIDLYEEKSETDLTIERYLKHSELISNEIEYIRKQIKEQESQKHIGENNQ